MPELSEDPHASASCPFIAERVEIALRRYFERASRDDAAMSASSIATACNMRTSQADSWLDGNGAWLKANGYVYDDGSVRREYDRLAVGKLLAVCRSVLPDVAPMMGSRHPDTLFLLERQGVRLKVWWLGGKARHWAWSITRPTGSSTGAGALLTENDLRGVLFEAFQAE